MCNNTIDSVLQSFAGTVPAPAGGATAALHAAQPAAGSAGEAAQRSAAMADAVLRPGSPPATVVGLLLEHTARAAEEARS